MRIPARALLALLVTGLLCTFLGTGLFALLEKRTALPAALDFLIATAFALGIFVIAVRKLGVLTISRDPGGMNPASADAESDGVSTRTWNAWLMALVGFSILVKVLYLDLLDLIPEEAYYWVYAQHPALSYLDHPPLVAWGIQAGTALFGHTEFGVRIFTLLCWFVTLFFLSGLTSNLFGEKTRLPLLLLGCLLPYTFIFGFFATPDAPLMASWAGTLYFLERALHGNRAAAWWGFGLCTGFGMLSKYSFALLGPSTLLVLLLDRQNRRWLLRPQPYLAVVLALLVFSPVLYWNQQHGWASLVFQGGRRLAERSAFKLPELLLFSLALLTPLGLVAGLHAIRHRKDWVSNGDPHPELASRRRLLLLAAVILPFSVFVFFSFTHRTKMSWTGPVWLALLPVLANQLTRSKDMGLFGFAWLRPRLWLPLTAFLALLYAGGFHYITLGLPLIPYPQREVKPVAWEELGQRLDQLLTDLEEKEGKEPLLIGLDRHFIASEASFYRGDKIKALRTTRTERIYGGNGTMYEWWFPEMPPRGTLALLVGFHLDQIENERIARYFDEAGPVHKVQIYKRGKPAGCILYRIAKGYDPTGSRKP